MSQIAKLYGVPAVIAIMYSSAVVAQTQPLPQALPMTEGGVLAMITLSVAGGIWLARRKR